MTIRKGCALLCALVLAAVCLLPGLPARRAAAEDSAQQVRIRLTQLRLTDRADLTLEGTYTCETAAGGTVAFPYGAQVTVVLRDGGLYLFYGDISISCGSAIRLVPHTRAGDELEGIRFRTGGNLYPGELHLSILGGQLLPVLGLSVEEYLLGVVPYEMSDSFPLEALKAQAVCARTYALSHINPDADWDMTDTTNDQVFYGIDTSNTNTAQAVEETAGIVGMWKGELAVCYYAASNGGQTETVKNVWGGEDVGCYAVTDDPYDV